MSCRAVYGGVATGAQVCSTAVRTRASPTGISTWPPSSNETDTSLFPKDGGYLLPLKDAVREPQGLSTADDVTVEITVRLKL